MDTVTLALQHTKRQLAQPFRFWQWTRLAVVGLLAGELASGGCNASRSFSQHAGNPRQLPDLGSIDPALIGLIVVLVVSGLVFGIFMLYVSSVMRFVLFDSVLAKECHIRQGWIRRQGPGLKLFLWQVVYALAVLAGAAVLVGIPAAAAFSAGWFHAPHEHVLGLALGGIALFFLMILFIVAAAIVHLFTKDFVVPQMALEGIGAVEGWRRLWPVVQAEKGGFAVYVLMKAVLAIGAGIIIAIVSLILGVLVAIPTVGLAIIAVLTGKSAGLTWNALTITLAAVVGCVLLAAFLYLLALVAVPAIVFFPAYAMYFFAARYRALGVAVYPAAPAQLPTGTTG
jgi:MFS family permease